MFYSCLVDRGLPAVIEEQGNGTAFVNFRSDSGVSWRLPSRGVIESTLVPTDATPENVLNALFEEFDAQDPFTYLLWIDDADRTEDLRECHEPTGYTYPDYWTDPAEILLMYQAQTDATNAWIACARDNGLPNLADVSVPAVDYDPITDRSHVARIPLSFTEEALTALLEACPPVNMERVKWTSTPHPEGEERPDLPDPLVGIEEPEGGADQEFLNSPQGEHSQALGRILGKTITRLDPEE
jgi:hypothetical protein